MGKYKVFISFKTSDENGDHTRSYFDAMQLNEKLKKLNMCPFFSEEQLEDAEDSAYPKTINTALSDALAFVLVIDKPEYLDTNWVKHEYETYAELANSGKKDLHSMFILGREEMLSAKLPIEFTGVQVDTKIDVLIEKLKKKLNVDGDNANKEDKSIHHIDFLSNDAEEKEKVDLGQVMMEAKWDYEYFNKNLTDISKVYNILDVCCENGINTRLVFNNFIKPDLNANIKINLLSGDENKEYIDEYNKKAYPNMHGEVIDFNSANWRDALIEAMKKHNIDKFDYVYCPSCLHCFTDYGEGFIKKINSFLRDGGIIYIRTFDDFLQIAYPDEDFDTMNEIVKRYGKCKGINDRSNARKMYKFLRNALYTSISIEHFCVDTLNKNPKQLEDIYESSFGFRKSVFKGNLDMINKEDIDKYNKAEQEYKENIKLLEKMHESILDAHYFAYFMSIAKAVKPSNTFGFYD